MAVFVLNADGLLRVSLVPPTPNNLSSSVLVGSVFSSFDLGTGPADRGLPFLFNKFPHITLSLVRRLVVKSFIFPGSNFSALLVRSHGVFCRLAWSRCRCFLFHFMALAPSPVDDIFWSIVCVDRRLILAIGLVPFLPSSPSTSITEARYAVLGSGGVGARSLALQNSLCGYLWPIKRFSVAAGACAQPSSMAPVGSASSDPFGGLLKGTLAGVPSVDLVATGAVNGSGQRRC